MKILKYLLIAFGIVFGGVGASFGYMLATGAFNPPVILPEDVYFVTDDNQSGSTGTPENPGEGEDGESEVVKITEITYNVYQDFQITIGTTTEKVTKTEIALSFPTTGALSSETKPVFDSEGKETNYITNGIIIVPKKVYIGTPFTVQLCKDVDDRVVEAPPQEGDEDEDGEGDDEEDSEPEDLSLYNVGGECVINFTPENNDLTILKAYVNVDVPVESIEIQTRTQTTDDVSQEQITNEFVIGSYLAADVLFTPQRSMYKYGRNGTRGTTEYKQVLFDLPADETNIIQLEEGGKIFLADRLTVSSGSTIKAYSYKNALFEDATATTSVYERIDEMTKKNSSGKPFGVSTEKTDVTILDVDVSGFVVNSAVSEIQFDLNRATTIYANRTNVSSVDNEFNLGITVSSSDGQVHASKISQVAISVETYDSIAQRYVDASEYIDITAFGEKIQYNFGTTGNPNVKNLYLPKINARQIKNSYWKLVTSQKLTGVKVFVYYLNLERDKVITQGGNYGPYNYNVEVNASYGSILSWSPNIELLTNKTAGATTTNSYVIVDNSQMSAVRTVVINLESLANVAPDLSVPTGKFPTYTTVRYFIYLNEEFYADAGDESSGFVKELDKITNTKVYEGKIDGLEIFGEEENGVLYEVESNRQLIISGIASIKLFFAIIETDYKGNPIYDQDGFYKIIELPQTYINNQQTLEYASIEVSKTLKDLNLSIELENRDANVVDRLVPNYDEIAGVNNDIYIVQGKEKSTNIEALTNKFSLGISSFKYKDGNIDNQETDAPEFGIFLKEFKQGNIYFEAYVVKDEVETPTSSVFYIYNDDFYDLKNFSYANLGVKDAEEYIEEDQIALNFFVGPVSEFNTTSEHILKIRIYAKYKLNEELNESFEFYVYSGAVKDVYFTATGEEESKLRDMEIGTQTNPIYIERIMSDNEEDAIVTNKYFISGAQFTMFYVEDIDKYVIDLSSGDCLVQSGLIDVESPKYFKTEISQSVSKVGYYYKKIGEDGAEQYVRIEETTDPADLEGITEFYECFEFGDLYIQNQAENYKGFNIKSITIDGVKYSGAPRYDAENKYAYVTGYMNNDPEKEPIVCFVEFRERIEVVGEAVNTILNVQDGNISLYCGIDGYGLNDYVALSTSDETSIEVKTDTDRIILQIVGSSEGRLVQIKAKPLHPYDDTIEDSVYFIINSNFLVTSQIDASSALSYDSNSKTFTFDGYHTLNGIKVKDLINIYVNGTEVTDKAKFTHNIANVELLDKLTITEDENGVSNINVTEGKDLGAGAYFNIIISYEQVGYYEIIGIRLNAKSSLDVNVQSHENSGAIGGETGSYGVFAEADVDVTRFEYTKKQETHKILPSTFDYYIEVEGIEIKLETTKINVLLDRYKEVNGVDDVDIPTEIRSALEGLSVLLGFDENSKLETVKFGAVKSKTKFRIIVRRNEEFYCNLDGQMFKLADIQAKIAAGEDRDDDKIVDFEGVKYLFKFTGGADSVPINPIAAYRIDEEGVIDTVNVYGYNFNQYGLEKVLVFYVSPNIKVSDAKGDNETIIETVENGSKVYYLNTIDTPFKTGDEIYWGFEKYVEKDYSNGEKITEYFTVVFNKYVSDYSEPYVGVKTLAEGEVRGPYEYNIEHTTVHAQDDGCTERKVILKASPEDKELKEYTVKYIKVPVVETSTNKALEFKLEYNGVVFTFKYYAAPNIVLSDEAKTIKYDGKTYLALYQGQEVYKNASGNEVVKLYDSWFGKVVKTTGENGEGEVVKKEFNATRIDYGVLSQTVTNTQSLLTTTSIKQTSTISKPSIGSWQKYEITPEGLLISNIRVYQQTETLESYVDYDVIILPLEWEYLKYSEVEYSRIVNVPENYTGTQFDLNVRLGVMVSESETKIENSGAEIEVGDVTYGYVVTNEIAQLQEITNAENSYIFEGDRVVIGNYIVEREARVDGIYLVVKTQKVYTGIKTYALENDITEYKIDLRDFDLRIPGDATNKIYKINQVEEIEIEEYSLDEPVETAEASKVYTMQKIEYDAKDILSGVYREDIESGHNYNMTSTTNPDEEQDYITDNLRRLFNGKATVSYANTITSSYMKVKDEKGNDITTYATLEPVAKGTNQYDIILKTLPVGEDKEVTIVITTQAYTIKYYLTIHKNQEIVVYYPHINGETTLEDNLDENGNLIQSFENMNTEHIFYEDFDENGKKYIDLLGKDTENFNTTATDPEDQGRRILVYVEDEVVDAKAELRYSVVLVKSNNTIISNINVINNLVQVSNNGIITLNKIDENSTIQIVIKIETINNAVNYYRITIHKKDSSYALFKGEIDITNDADTRFDVEQGSTAVLNYSLKKTEDSLVNDVTSTELKYAVITNQDMFKLDGFNVTAMESPNDEEATLIAYTAYGRVKTIRLQSESKMTWTIKDGDVELDKTLPIVKNGDTTVNLSELIKIKTGLEAAGADSEYVDLSSGVTWQIVVGDNYREYIDYINNVTSSIKFKPVNKTVNLEALIKIYSNEQVVVYKDKTYPILTEEDTQYIEIVLDGETEPTKHFIIYEDGKTYISPHANGSGAEECRILSKLPGTSDKKPLTFTIKFTIDPNITTKTEVITQTYLSNETFELEVNNVFVNENRTGDANDVNTLLSTYELSYEVISWNDGELAPKIVQNAKTGLTEITFPSLKQDAKATINLYLEKQGVKFISTFIFDSIKPDVNINLVYPLYGTDQEINKEYIFYGDYPKGTTLDLFASYTKNGKLGETLGTKEYKTERFVMFNNKRYDVKLEGEKEFVVIADNKYYVENNKIPLENSQFRETVKVNGITYFANNDENQPKTTVQINGIEYEVSGGKVNVYDDILIEDRIRLEVLKKSEEGFIKTPEKVGIIVDGNGENEKVIIDDADDNVETKISHEVTFNSTSPIVKVSKDGKLTISAVSKDTEVNIEIYIDGILRGSYILVVKPSRAITIAETQYNMTKEIIETTPQTEVNPFAIQDGTLKVSTKMDAYSSLYSITINATPKEILANKPSYLELTNASITLWGRASANEAMVGNLYYKKTPAGGLVNNVKGENGKYKLSEIFSMENTRYITTNANPITYEQLEYLRKNIDLYNFTYVSSHSNVTEVEIEAPYSIIDFYYNNSKIPAYIAGKLMRYNGEDEEEKKVNRPLEEFEYKNTIHQVDKSDGSEPITNKEYSVQVYNNSDKEITKFTFIWKFNYAFSEGTYEKINNPWPTSTIGNVYDDLSEFSKLVGDSTKVNTDGYTADINGSLLKFTFDGDNNITRNLKVDVTITTDKPLYEVLESASEEEKLKAKQVNTTIIINQVSGIMTYTFDLDRYVFTYQHENDIERVSFEKLQTYFDAVIEPEEKLIKIDENFSFVFSINSVYVTKTIELGAGYSYSLVDILVSELGLRQYDEITGDFTKNYNKQETSIKLTYPEDAYIYTTNKLYFDKIQDLVGIQEIKIDDKKIIDYTITPHGAQNNGDYVHLNFSIGLDKTVYILRIKVLPNININAPTETIQIQTKNAAAALKAESPENKYVSTSLEELGVSITYGVAQNANSIVVTAQNNAQYIVGAETGNLLNAEGEIQFAATVLGGIEIALKIEDEFGYYKIVDVLLMNSTSIVPTLSTYQAGIFEGDEVAIYFWSSDNSYYKYDYDSGNLYLVEEANANESSFVIANIEDYYYTAGFNVELSGSELFTKNNNTENARILKDEGRVPLLEATDYINGDTINGKNLYVTVKVENENVLYGQAIEECVISLPIAIKKRYKVAINYEINDKVYLRNNYEGHKLSDFVTIYDLKDGRADTSDINDIAQYDGTRESEVSINEGYYVLYGYKVENAYYLYTDNNYTNLFSGNVRNFLGLTTSNFRKGDFVFYRQVVDTGTGKYRPDTNKNWLAPIQNNLDYSIQDNGGFAILNIPNDCLCNESDKGLNTFRIVIKTNPKNYQIGLTEARTESNLVKDLLIYKNDNDEAFVGNKLTKPQFDENGVLAGGTSFITITYKGLKHNVVMVYDFTPYVYSLDVSKMYYDASHGVVVDSKKEENEYEYKVELINWIDRLIFTDKANSIVSYINNKTFTDGNIVKVSNETLTNYNGTTNTIEQRLKFNDFIEKANITFAKVSGTGRIDKDNNLIFTSLTSPSMEVEIFADGVSVGVVKVTLRTYKALQLKNDGVALQLSNPRVIPFSIIQDQIETIKQNGAKTNGLQQGGGFLYTILRDLDETSTQITTTSDKAVMPNYAVENWNGTSLSVGVAFWGKYLATINFTRSLSTPTIVSVTISEYSDEKTKQDKEAVNNKYGRVFNPLIETKGVSRYDLQDDFYVKDYGSNSTSVKATDNTIVKLSRFNSSAAIIDNEQAIEESTTLTYNLYTYIQSAKIPLSDIIDGLRISVTVNNDTKISWLLSENIGMKDGFTFWEYVVEKEAGTEDYVATETLIKDSISLNSAEYFEDRFIKVRYKHTKGLAEGSEVPEPLTYNPNKYTEEYAKSDTYFLINIKVNKTPIYDAENSYIPKGKGAINLLDADGKTVITKVLFSKWAEVIDSYSDNGDSDEQTRNFGFYRKDGGEEPTFVKYSLSTAASEFKYKLTYDDENTTRNNQYKFSTKPVVGTDNSLLNLQSGDIITLIIYANDDVEMKSPLYEFEFIVMIGGQVTVEINSNIKLMGEGDQVTKYSLAATDYVRMYVPDTNVRDGFGQVAGKEWYITDARGGKIYTGNEEKGRDLKNSKFVTFETIEGLDEKGEVTYETRAYFNAQGEEKVYLVEEDRDNQKVTLKDIPTQFEFNGNNPLKANGTFTGVAKPGNIESGGGSDNFEVIKINDVEYVKYKTLSYKVSEEGIVTIPMDYEISEIDYSKPVSQRLPANVTVSGTALNLTLSATGYSYSNPNEKVSIYDCLYYKVDTDNQSLKIYIDTNLDGAINPTSELLYEGVENDTLATLSANWVEVVNLTLQIDAEGYYFDSDKIFENLNSNAFKYAKRSIVSIENKPVEELSKNIDYTTLTISIMTGDDYKYYISSLTDNNGFKLDRSGLSIFESAMFYLDPEDNSVDPVAAKDVWFKYGAIGQSVQENIVQNFNLTTVSPTALGFEELLGVSGTGYISGNGYSFRTIITNKVYPEVKADAEFDPNSWYIGSKENTFNIGVTVENSKLITLSTDEEDVKFDVEEYEYKYMPMASYLGDRAPKNSSLYMFRTPVYVDGVLDRIDYASDLEFIQIYDAEYDGGSSSEYNTIRARIKVSGMMGEGEYQESINSDQSGLMRLTTYIHETNGRELEPSNMWQFYNGTSFQPVIPKDKPWGKSTSFVVKYGSSSVEFSPYLVEINLPKNYEFDIDKINTSAILKAAINKAFNKDVNEKIKFPEYDEDGEMTDDFGYSNNIYGRDGEIAGYKYKKNGDANELHATPNYGYTTVKQYNQDLEIDEEGIHTTYGISKTRIVLRMPLGNVKDSKFEVEGMSSNSILAHVSNCIKYVKDGSSALFVPLSGEFKVNLDASKKAKLVGYNLFYKLDGFESVSTNVISKITVGKYIPVAGIDYGHILYRDYTDKEYKEGATTLTTSKVVDIIYKDDKMVSSDIEIVSGYKIKNGELTALKDKFTADVTKLKKTYLNKNGEIIYERKDPEDEESEFIKPLETAITQDYYLVRDMPVYRLVPIIEQVQ